MQAGVGHSCVLPFCVLGLRLGTSFPSWSVPLGGLPAAVRTATPRTTTESLFVTQESKSPLNTLTHLRSRTGSYNRLGSGLFRTGGDTAAKRAAYSTGARSKRQSFEPN